MTQRARPRPKARCTTCGTVSIYSEHIGQRCAARPNGSRCPGRFRAATAWDDWLACPACRSTGLQAGEACGPCGGEGWLYFVQPAIPDGDARPAATAPRGNRNAS
jgi:hypothetical protein